MIARVLCALALIAVATLAAFLVGGCASPRVIVETQEVLIPVPVECRPPAELAEPYRPEALPQWLPPTHPQATSALDAEGERTLRAILIDLMTRDRAWRALAKE